MKPPRARKPKAKALGETPAASSSAATPPAAPAASAEAPAAPAASSSAATSPAAPAALQRVVGLPARPRLRVSFGWDGDKLTCEALLMDERREALRRSSINTDDPSVGRIFSYFATMLVNELRASGVLVTAPAISPSSAAPPVRAVAPRRRPRLGDEASASSSEEAPPASSSEEAPPASSSEEEDNGPPTPKG